MHLLLISMLAAACAAAPQFPKFHAPGAGYPGAAYPGPGYSGTSYQGANYPALPVERRYGARHHAARDRAAAILRADTQLTENGYNYAFETDNGIQAQQTGVEAGGTQAAGSYSYEGPDGRRYSVRYAAGAGGFRAEGAHLPTPPPPPAAVARALRLNAADEARGIFDDGSYRAAGSPRLRNPLIHYRIF